MIAKEGLLFVLSGGLLTILTIWIANKLDNGWWFVASLILGLLTLFTTYFFRDPQRVIPDDANALVSPADGRIVMIDTLARHEFINGPAVQVSVFLSVFDVHVNRVPCTGEIKYVHYNPGKFLAAYEDKASLVNEQTEIGLLAQTGQPVVFKQIAGLIARRIVCHLTEGESASRGDRFGMIRFGSRADVILPLGSELAVKVGDKVKGGVSIIGYLTTGENVTQEAEPDA